MRPDDRGPAGAPVSRGVYMLARAARFSAKDAAALGDVAPTIDALRGADAGHLAEALHVDPEHAERLVGAARLTSLPGVAPSLAAELFRRDVTLDSLVDADASALASRLGDLPGVDEDTIARWSVAAHALARSGRRDDGERFPPVRPPSPAEPPVLRRIVLDREGTWQEIADRMFARRDGVNGDRAALLAQANRSPLDARLPAGTVVTLPDADRLRDSLPSAAAAATAIRAFAPYLAPEEAAALAAAGVTDPRLLPALATLVDGSQTGVDELRLRRVQLHARLAAIEDMPPDVANYLAGQYTTLERLVRTSPREILTDLVQARAIGLLRTDLQLSPNRVFGWLGDVSVLTPGGTTLDTDATVCDTALPPATFLENYYAYRFSPAGRTAEELQLELDDKNEWLTEVDDYLSGVVSQQRTASFVERGLRTARISIDDLLQWGGNASSSTDTNTLTLLRDFVRESARIVQLLQSLTAGNEAYRHRQYGLALSCYQRADDWFAANVDAKWYRNAPAGAGAYKPSFLVQYESNPSSTSAIAVLKPTHDFYLKRANPDPGSDLLAALQVEVADYHRWRINPAVATAPVAPFRRYLYYIYNFMLPALRGDCHVRLGNFCGALDEYFRVYQEPAFTQQLDTPREQTMTTAVRGAGGAAPLYGSLSTFATAPAPETRYYAPYLHDLERRVIRLRVAEALLAWGDVHYRRRENALAEACYAQVLRLAYADWNALRAIQFTDYDTYRGQVEAQGVNPRSGELAGGAHQQLLKVARRLNFLGYSDEYVPIWTYTFLLTSARYFAERARQLGRDALQFLGAAEQEQGNRRLLVQSVAISQGQLAVESRRVDEARAGVAVSEAGSALADQRSANNENRREELDSFGPIRQTLGIVGGAIGGASSGASLGGMGGGAFAAGGAIAGATYGGVSAYVSGCIEMQMQKNEFERQRLELEKAQAMAVAEVARAQTGVSVAQLSRNVAALGTVFAQSNLAFAQAKSLNAEFWFGTSLRLSDMASSYLERAIGVAFLAEQAFEFMEGRRLDVIRFDYSQSEGVLSADALLADLDSIEYERISGRLVKTMPVKHVVRLRERDFLSFAELKRTGTITFETPLFDFDQSHPGSYHQRVASVEVEVRALVPPGGIRGTLRKSGLSYLRYRVGAQPAGAPPLNSAADWVQYTPTPFRLAPVIQSDETLILSAFDTRTDTVLLRPDPGEQLRIFEGSGAGSTWSLSIRPFSNDFDFSTITDVDLVVYYYSQYDERLERALSLERRKLFALRQLTLHRTRGFSLGDMFPDALYFLQNPPAGGADPWRERSVQIDVTEQLFPPNQVGRRATGVTLVFFGANDFVDVHASLSGTGLALAVGDFRAAPELDPRVRAADPAGHTPVDRWTLTLRADDNTPGLTSAGRYAVDGAGRVRVDEDGQPIASAGGVLIFDPAKLATVRDIWVIFDYSYDQGGADGEPVVFWAHYASDPADYYAEAGVRRQLAGWTVANSAGAAAWAVVQGRRTQTAANATSVVRPTAAFVLGDMAIEADVVLPSSAGRAAGLVFRYDPAVPSYYRARLARTPANRLTIALDRVDAAGSVELTKLESAALSGSTRFTLGVRAQGSVLEVSLDGRRLLRAVDATLATGTFGLFASGPDVSFDELLVSDLTGR